MANKVIPANYLTFILLLFINGLSHCYGQEPCTVRATGIGGTCKGLRECESVLMDVRQGKRDYTLCNFAQQILSVCCPNPVQLPTSDRMDSEEYENDETKRISEKKCHQYAKAVFQKTFTIPLVANAPPRETKKDQCGFKSVPLIVGGTMAKPREFPHMTLIGFNVNNNVQWACGGSLISERYVLTAAHCCFSQLGKPKFIRIGELTIDNGNEEDDPIDYNVTEVISHPSFRRTSKYNDIALLKLDRDVVFNAFRRPACLPREHENSAKKVIASGWGRTEWAGSTSSYLQKVVLDKFSHEECNGTYAQQFNSKLPNGIQYTNQICAGSKSEVKDTCQGDSGGPIQIYHTSEYCMYDLVGITSFGIMCGTPNVPGVYTRIFPYLDWIEKTVWG